MLKRVPAISVLLSLVAAAYSQSAKLAYVIDLKSGISSPVALQRLGTATDVLGFAGVNLNVSAFAGPNADGRPHGGIWVSYNIPLARNVTCELGPGITFEGGRWSTRSVVVGISYQF